MWPKTENTRIHRTIFQETLPKARALGCKPLEPLAIWIYPGSAWSFVWFSETAERERKLLPPSSYPLLPPYHPVGCGQAQGFSWRSAQGFFWCVKTLEYMCFRFLVFFPNNHSDDRTIAMFHAQAGVKNKHCIWCFVNVHCKT